MVIFYYKIVRNKWFKFVPDRTQLVGHRGFEGGFPLHEAGKLLHESTVRVRQGVGGVDRAPVGGVHVLRFSLSHFINVLNNYYLPGFKPKPNF